MILTGKNTLCFRYDGTFEGLLSCVFETFALKRFPSFLVRDEIPLLFTETYTVFTDDEKANRVLTGLHRKISKSAVEMLFTCWLSELDRVDMSIFRYICKSFKTEQSIELNFADPDVLELSKIYKKVMRESEHVRQFVRFQKTVDGIYFACIEPIYNVLPCNADFFADRFADQTWIIYDVKRKYALYYDLHKTEIVRFDSLQIDTATGRLSPEQADAGEIDFQQLWQQYLKDVTIQERINLKLQRQHMPKRFWKYLPEKYQNIQ